VNESKDALVVRLHDQGQEYLKEHKYV
jgi:hypothetical protein